MLTRLPIKELNETIDKIRHIHVKKGSQFTDPEFQQEFKSIIYNMLYFYYRNNKPISNFRCVDYYNFHLISSSYGKYVIINIYRASKVDYNTRNICTNCTTEEYNKFEKEFLDEITDDGFKSWLMLTKILDKYE